MPAQGKALQLDDNQKHVVHVRHDFLIGAQMRKRSQVHALSPSLAFRLIPGSNIPKVGCKVRCHPTLEKPGFAFFGIGGIQQMSTCPLTTVGLV